jgi:hypothetical protein
MHEIWAKAYIEHYNAIWTTYMAQGQDTVDVGCKFVKLEEYAAAKAEAFADTLQAKLALVQD